MTLTSLVAAWIDARSINRAPSTVSGYRRLNRLYIAPSAVGAKEITTLTGADMVVLLSPLIERGCTRQAQLLQTLVSAALKGAVKRREIPWNPMDELDRVQHSSRCSPWLTVDQAKRLLACSAEAGDRYYIAWVLMLCCGLRRGEMLALRWSDIDEARKVIHITRQRIHIDGRTLITRPKSVSSCRDIPLDDDLLSLLRLCRRSDGDILHGVSADTLAAALDRALARADLPRVTLHGLRHTMAAVAAGNGTTVKVLQTIMGHAHYQTTADIYAHVNQAPRIQAVHLIAHALLPPRLEIV